MSRTEIRRLHENRQSYYEGMYRAQSYSYPFRKAYTEKKSMKKTSLDTILFTIIKGLLACLVIVILLATLCAAADSSGKTAPCDTMTPERSEHCSVNTTIDSTFISQVFSLSGE